MPPVKLLCGSRCIACETLHFCSDTFCLCGPALQGLAEHQHLQAVVLAGVDISQLPPVELFKIGLGTLTGFFGNTVPLAYTYL